MSLWITEHVHQLAAGPLPHTMTDFWRMVWQEQVTLIVMLCNTVEGHKVRCQQYWPSSGSQNYGPFRIKLESEYRFADYTLRTFKIMVCELYILHNVSSSHLQVVIDQYFMFIGNFAPREFVSSALCKCIT